MKYFIVSGEASGDLHSANLMKEIKKKDDLAEFFFMGGDKMTEVGGVILRHFKYMAFMGFWSVLINYKKIAENFKIAHEAILKIKPDLIILVDYPGFNLRIAKFVKKYTQIPVLYYIAPKLWAWKSYRIKDIKKYVDQLITIFPFETQFFGKYNYPVFYAGNPSVDSVAEGLKNVDSEMEFRLRNQLNQKPIIALLPGSRKQEINACLPKMIQAAREFKTHQIVIAASESIPDLFYESIGKESNIKLVNSQTYALLTYSDIAVVNSGTATLETALIQTPQVVVYDIMLGRLGFLIKDLVIKTKYVSLVNIIAGKEVVKELLGYQFTSESLYEEMTNLSSNLDYRKKMLDGYAEIANKLGPKGSSERAADIMIDFLKKSTE